MITGIYYDLFTHVFRIAGVQSKQQSYIPKKDVYKRQVKDIMKLALDAITVNGEGAVSGEQKEEE